VVLLEEESSFAVATVSKEDLSARPPELQDTTLLVWLASEMYGVPRSSIITSEEYESVVQVIRGREIWARFDEDYTGLFGINGSAGYLSKDIDSRIRTFGQALNGFKDWDPASDYWEGRTLLARHGLLSQLGHPPNTDIAQATLFPGLPSFSFILQNRHDGRALTYLEEHDISPEAFLLALEVHDSALVPSYKVREVLPELYDYHVPFGASPEIRLDTLYDVLRGAVTSVIVRHDRKMRQGLRISVLASERDDVVGIGSPELPGQLQEVIVRGRSGH
jgi:hypothetical protein